MPRTSPPKGGLGLVDMTQKPPDMVEAEPRHGRGERRDRKAKSEQAREAGNEDDIKRVRADEEEEEEEEDANARESKVRGPSKRSKGRRLQTKCKEVEEWRNKLDERQKELEEAKKELVEAKDEKNEVSKRSQRSPDAVGRMRPAVALCGSGSGGGKDRGTDGGTE